MDRLQSENLGSTVPERASVPVDVFVSVHPPKFQYMISFHKSFCQCKFAWDQMKLVLVFSTTLESLDYQRLLNTTCPDFSVGYSVLVTPEWIGQKYTSNIPALKKMFGPALALDAGNLSSYFLMMDSEVQLICQNWGNSSLFHRIIRKSQNKTWVAGGPSSRKGFPKGFPEGFPVPKGFTDGVTWVINNNVDIMRRTMNLSKTEEDIISLETSGFLYYSWWTDLPWYQSDHFGSMLQRMGPFRNESYVSLLQKLHNQMRNGKNPNSVFQLPPTSHTFDGGGAADWLFEQIVYQYWTLIQHGYKFHLIQCNCVDNFGCITMNEGLSDILVSTDKVCRQTTLDFIGTSPLWIPDAAVKCWPEYIQQTFLFSFHHDSSSPRCNS